jgi:glycosyltransferase involved in cell wall biosynthesis
VESLRQDGVRVDVLGWSRPFDVRPAWTLRELVRDFQPDVIHAWKPAAIRSLVVTGCPPGGLLVSAGLPPGRPPAWPDRWLLRGAAGVVAFGSVEAERYRRLGVSADRLTVVNPAVSLPDAIEPAELPGVHPGAAVLLCVGPIEIRKGFLEAVWASDMLHHLDDDLRLVLAGTGPDRVRIERFVRHIGAADWVHFTGPIADPASLFARADVVLAPSLQEGGRGAVLEAMAASRPVIAGHTPGLAEVVVEGVTGYLVNPHIKGTLARRARALLTDPDRRRSFGAAGRQRAADLFSTAALVHSIASLYAARTEGKKARRGA